MLYERKNPLNVFGSQVQHTSLGAPVGVSMSSQLMELLRDITAQINLRDAGVLTPWASRVGDLEWREIKPDTNIATFEITDKDIQLIQETVLFGQRLPFVGVLSGQYLSESELDKVLTDSPYEWYETIAVYRQDDSNPVPPILFFYWLKSRTEDELVRGTKKTAEQAANGMFGRLVYAQQVPVASSTLRQPPAISFAEAFGIQEPDPLAPEPTVVTTRVPTTVNPEPEKETVQQATVTQYALPVLLGLGVAVSTAYLFRKAGIK